MSNSGARPGLQDKACTLGASPGLTSVKTDLARKTDKGQERYQLHAWNALWRIWY